MGTHKGIEILTFRYAGERGVHVAEPILVGVVGSGNLEILIERHTPPDCVVHVETSAHGFQPIWQAVMDDFHARHRLSGVQIAINDMGATPAVVALRLDQAVAELLPENTP